MPTELWIDIQDMLIMVFYPAVVGYYMIALAGSLLLAVMGSLTGILTKKLNL